MNFTSVPRLSIAIPRRVPRSGILYRTPISTAKEFAPYDANEEYNTGLEYTFDGRFFLRGGYKFGYDAENWTAGFGLNFYLLGVNGSFGYGYDNFKWLPGTNTISFAATL